MTLDDKRYSFNLFTDFLFVFILKKLGVSHQGHLTSVLNKLFPGENILSNVRKEGNVINPSTGRFLEIDLWLPNHLISFEFQVFF